MERIVAARVWSTRLFNLQRQGRIGTMAPIDGMEAAIVGTTAALDPATDWVFPQYREPVALSRFGDEVIDTHVLYLLGHPGGGCYPPHVHVFPTQISLAAQLPHAVGFAWGNRLRRDPGVVAVFVGDGATSEGDFYEAANFAGVLRAPVVFVIVNNHWAISTPLDHQSAVAALSRQGGGRRLPRGAGRRARPRRRVRGRRRGPGPGRRRRGADARRVRHLPARAAHDRRRSDPLRARRRTGGREGPRSPPHVRPAADGAGPVVGRHRTRRRGPGPWLASTRPSPGRRPPSSPTTPSSATSTAASSRNGSAARPRTSRRNSPVMRPTPPAMRPGRWRRRDGADAGRGGQPDARGGDGPRRAGRGVRSGRRNERRGLPGHRRPAGPLRRRAGGRHATGRGGDRRHGRGSGRLGHGAGGRDPVPRLHLPGDAPARRPGGPPPLPLERPLRRRRSRSGRRSGAGSGRRSCTPRRWRVSSPTSPASRSSCPPVPPTRRACWPAPSATPTRCWCWSRCGATGPCGARCPTTRTAATSCPSDSSGGSRDGDDLVIVAWSYMVEIARRAAEALEEEGFSVGVVDLRTVVPLDLAGMADAVSGRRAGWWWSRRLR